MQYNETTIIFVIRASAFLGFPLVCELFCLHLLYVIECIISFNFGFKIDEFFVTYVQLDSEMVLMISVH